MSAGRGVREDEAGFSLVEAVVAMAILMVVLVAVLGSLLMMTKGTVFARQNQQSIELTSRKIEALRALPIGDLANRDNSALANDPLVGGTSGARTFDPDGSGPLPLETVITSATGQVASHQESATVNGTVYTTKTFVTTPKTNAGAVDASGSYRRLTVIVTWQKAPGRVATKRTSTFVTATRRGLPHPQFTWGSAVTKQVTAGAQLALAATLVNQGARDSWALSVSVDPATTLSWNWYVDVDASGTLSSGDTALPADGSGAVSTGQVATDETRRLLAVADVPAGTANGLRRVELTALSVAQPNASSASRNFVNDITVIGGSGSAPLPSPTASASTAPIVSASSSPSPIPIPTASPLGAVGTACTACNSRTLTLLNNAFPAGSGADDQSSLDYVSPMPVTTEAPRSTALVRMGADEALGRFLAKGGTLGDSGKDKRATWQYQAPRAMNVQKVAVRLFLRAKDAASGKSLGLRLEVYNGTEPIGSGDLAPVSGDSTTWEARTVQASITAGKEAVANSDRLSFVVYGHNSSGDDLRLAYATTEHPARVSLYGSTGY